MSEPLVDDEPESVATQGEPTPPPASDRRWIVAVIFFGTLLLYAKSLPYPFLNMDDPQTVQHAHVQTGLTAANVKWAFTSVSHFYWQPLTWISFQANASLTGSENVRGYRAVNILLHAANAALFFHVLLSCTGAAWRSAIAAALFAAHPTHVESVVWVAERKDVLSTFFWLLTIEAYARYARGPSVGRYLVVAGAFAFGLMSKPMVVTLPFVLLLLDYWPLARPNRRWPWLIAEKLPLIGMAIAVSVVTYIGQRGSGAVVGLSRLTPDYRAANAVISYGEYLRATVAPVDLAVYYPFEPHHFTDADVLLAVAVLVGATLVCMRYASRAPYLPVGWLWFVGTLVPVIGIVQAGGQARADRFVYVPHLGLFVLLVWGAADLLNRFKVSQQAVKLIPGFVLLACVILTWRQVGLWRTNTTIWTHTLEVTGDRNAVAETNLGIALAMDENRLNDALPHLKRGAELDPENALPLRWYGVVLAKTGRPDQAIEPLRGTLKLDPTHSDAQKILASILFEKGRYEEAVEHLAVIETSPRPVASARTRLGSMLVQRGNLDDARDQLELAATDDPGSVEAHTFLGICELLAARYELAEARLREALGLDPKAAMANAYLGTIQAYRGQWPEAVMSYEKATAANPKSAAFQAGLGLALTGAGRGWDAKAAYGEAFKLDPKWAETTIAMFWHQQSRPNPLPVSADTWAKVQAVCEATDSRDPRAIEALAAVRAAEGKFSDAEQLVRKAAADADQAGLKPLADQFRNQADRYKAGKTHRDPWP